MVSAFVNAYYAGTHIPVVGVSASKGGSVIREWQPGSPYLSDALDRLLAAEKWLEHNGFLVRHIYVLWCQGNRTETRAHKKKIICNALTGC